MHGQNREKYKSRLRDPTTSAAIAQKANKWNYLSKEILLRRGKLSPPSPTPSSMTVVAESATLDDENLQLTEKMLSLNPDPSHLWNFRRELLFLKSNDQLFIIDKELKLTALCLQKNPKAYAAWTHRKYCIRSWLLLRRDATNEVVVSSNEKLTLLGKELALCGDFLKSDERNFHCWNYRRFIVAATALAKTMDDNDTILKDNTQLDLDGSWPSSTSHQLMGPQLSSTTSPPSIASLDKSLIESEWNFTLAKIQSNFSNYSAFHYRSKILPLMLPSSWKTYDDVLTLAKAEVVIIQNAIFTEPDDQTAWWYHHFVINWADPKNYDAMETNNNDVVVADDDNYISFLEEDADAIRELIEMEEGQCKWGLLALLMLLRKLAGFCGKDGGGKRESLKREAEDCLAKLKDIDPDRLRRYESMRL